VLVTSPQKLQHKNGSISICHSSLNFRRRPIGARSEKRVARKRMWHVLWL
jgi:hypothetical protein